MAGPESRSRGFECPLIVASCALAVACGSGGSGGGAGAASSGVDIALSSLVAPESAKAGQSIALSVVIANHGSKPGSGAVQFVLSSDSQIDEYDTQIDLAIPAIALMPGESVPAKTTAVVFPNLATGTYYVGAIAPPFEGEATPANNYIGRPLHVDGTSCTQDAYEEDDTRELAKPIQIAEPQLHDFCEDEVDWVSFQATAAQSYVFAADPTGPGPTPVLAVFDATGPDPLETLTTNPAAKLLTWTAPATALYFLRAKTTLASTGAQTGYSLLLGDDRPDVVMGEVSQAGVQSNPGDLVGPGAIGELRGLTKPASVEFGIYLSTDAQIGTDDRLLGLRVLSGDEAEGSLALLASVPADVVPGSYYLGAIADPEQKLAELSEDNNASDARPIDIAALSCTPDAFEQDDVQQEAKPIALGEFQTHNFCDDLADWVSFDATQGTAYAIDFAHNAQFSVEITLWDADGTNLVPGGPAGFTWTAPSDGTYFIHVGPESNSTFDPKGTSDEYTVRVQPAMPDLFPTKLDAWAGLYSGGQTPVDVAVQNGGGAKTTPFNITLYLSTDNQITSSDTKLAEHIGDILDWMTGYNTIGYQFTVDVPSSVAPGNYYLGLVVDSADQVTESDETNNVMVVAVSVQ